MSWMVLCRVLHLAATCTSLGGLFYVRAVLWPALDRLPAAAREDHLRTVIRRFAWIKWTGVLVVAATGVFQWVALWPHVADRGLYTLYFAVKMAGAIGLFTITFLLALPTRLRRRRAFWSGLNVVCGALILTGAALMRTVART